MESKKLNHLELVPKDTKNIFILLHGYGSDAEDLFNLGLRFRDLLPHTALISVEAPDKCEIQHGGYQWFSLKTMNLFTILKEIRVAHKLLEGFINEQLKRFKLTSNNLIIGGFSQGAMISLYTGLRIKPAPIAILSFSGMLPDTVESLEREIKSKPKVFLCHGTGDTMVPYNSLEKAESVLREFDIECESHSVRAMDHMINNECLDYARDFIKKLNLL
ncbi:MAG TPA: hypothetical protein VLL98_04505 [Rickettsiales bacterium]|nr:hypothetical protein [Rickettsiales bacterium]